MTANRKTNQSVQQGIGFRTQDRFSTSILYFPHNTLPPAKQYPLFSTGMDKLSSGGWVFVTLLDESQSTPEDLKEYFSFVTTEMFQGSLQQPGGAQFASWWQKPIYKYDDSKV